MTDSLSMSFGPSSSLMGTPCSQAANHSDRQTDRQSIHQTDGLFIHVLWSQLEPDGHPLQSGSQSFRQTDRQTDSQSIRQTDYLSMSFGPSLSLMGTPCSQAANQSDRQSINQTDRHSTYVICVGKWLRANPNPNCTSSHSLSTCNALCQSKPTNCVSSQWLYFQPTFTMISGPPDRGRLRETPPAN